MLLKLILNILGQPFSENCTFDVYCVFQSKACENLCISRILYGTNLISLKEDLLYTNRNQILY